MVICEFDKTEHASIQDLHDYFRRWKLRQATYYHEYHPRRDRLTGELIPYKDYAQYHSQDFANKVNLKRWLKENREEGLIWSIDFLKRRKEEKGLVYAPCQVELRTLMCPSIPYYDSWGAARGGYDGITKSLGFQSRFLTASLHREPLDPTSTLIQDTREQKPIKLSISTKIDTLDIGDYALAAPHDTGIRIERKSLNDFCGTLSGRAVTLKSGTKDSAFQRFDRELARAKEKDLYVVMMVESDINEAQSFNFLPHMRHVKASPQYIFHNLRELLVKYPLHFQVLFVAGRAEMAERMVKVFQLGSQVRTTDLQLAHEEGRL